MVQLLILNIVLSVVALMTIMRKMRTIYIILVTVAENLQQPHQMSLLMRLTSLKKNMKTMMSIL